MKRHLEVLFSPAEFDTLPSRDLSETTCVVFDVLRATTSMITALANGARAILPVADIPEALAAKRRQPDALRPARHDDVRARQRGHDERRLTRPRGATAVRGPRSRATCPTGCGTRPCARACAARPPSGRSGTRT